MPEAILDTSPVQYLYQLGLFDLLPIMHEEVIVPFAVASELERGRQQGISLPDVWSVPWINVCAAQCPNWSSAVTGLGRGEVEVLSLGMERKTALIIVDDSLARCHARRLSLRYTGTIGVLLKAKEMGHISALRPVIHYLNELGFHLDRGTWDAVLKVAGEKET